MLISLKGDYVETTYWSAIETYVSIIVTSLPAIRSLLSRSFPKLFNFESRNSSHKTYEQSQKASNSYKMKSWSKSTTAATSSDLEIEPGDYFTNPRLELGDKMKGEVRTGVTSGRLRRERSEAELVERGEGIFIHTEITAGDRASNENSWLDDGETISNPKHEQ